MMVKHIDEAVKYLDDNFAWKKKVPVSNSKRDNFAPALAAAGRALTATMMAMLPSRGFSDVTPAFSSLMPLLDENGARPTALAQRAGITKQAISQLVRELEVRGYVE